MTVPGQPYTLSTDASQAISSTFQITPANIGNFATRFANTWNNYRVLQVDFEIFAIAASTGAVIMYFDERTTTLTPTSTIASEAVSTAMLLNGASPKSVCKLTYRTKELNDLTFTDCGAPVSIGNLNFWRSTSFCGPASVSTAVLFIKPTFYLEFKTLLS
jgi:hypothetical protein